MDGTTFDRLARTMAGGLRPRRAVLKSLAGGALAAPLALAADEAAAGRCRKRLKTCTRAGQCCGRKVRCATSHGAGSDTCCGGQGATCSSDLTCCVPLFCNGGRCGPTDEM